MELPSSQVQDICTQEIPGKRAILTFLLKNVLAFTNLFSQMLLLNVADKIPLLLGFELAVVVCVGDCARALPNLKKNLIKIKK